MREIRAGKGMLIVEGDPDCRSAGSFFKNPILPEAEYARLQSSAHGAGSAVSCRNRNGKDIRRVAD